MYLKMSVSEKDIYGHVSIANIQQTKVKVYKSKTRRHWLTDELVNYPQIHNHSRSKTPRLLFWSGYYRVSNIPWQILRASMKEQCVKEGIVLMPKKGNMTCTTCIKKYII